MGLLMFLYTQLITSLGPIGCLVAPVTIPLSLLLGLISRGFHLLGIHTYSIQMDGGEFRCLVCFQSNRNNS